MCLRGALSRIVPPPMVSSGEKKRMTKGSPFLLAMDSVMRS